MPTKLAPGIVEKRPGYFEVRVYGGLDPLTGKARQVTRAVKGSVKDANALRAQMLTEVGDKGVAVRRSRSGPSGTSPMDTLSFMHALLRGKAF